MIGTEKKKFLDLLISGGAACRVTYVGAEIGIGELSLIFFASLLRSLSY